VAGDCSDAAYVFRPVRSSTKDNTGAHVANMDGPSIYGPWVETNRQGAIKAGAAPATRDSGKQYLYPGQPAQVNLDFRYPVTTGDTGQLRYELLATFGCEGTVGSVAVGNVDTFQSVDDGSAPLPPPRLFLSPRCSCNLSHPFHSCALLVVSPDRCV